MTQDDTARPIIYTLGYSGHKPEYIKAQVDELGALLVDVRYSPRTCIFLSAC